MAKTVVVTKENDKFAWTAYSNGDISIKDKAKNTLRGCNYGSPVIDACLRPDNVFCGINANSVMYVFQYDETAKSIKTSAKCFPFAMNNPKKMDLVDGNYVIKTPNHIYTVAMTLKLISKVKI